jgi:hypothetical protein
MPIVFGAFLTVLPGAAARAAKLAIPRNKGGSPPPFAAARFAKPRNTRIRQGARPAEQAM